MAGALGAGDQVGEELLDHGMPSVYGFGLDQREGGVGEHRVMSLGWQEFLLAVAVLEAADSADDQPGGDAMLLLGFESGVGGFGDLRSQTYCPMSSS